MQTKPDLAVIVTGATSELGNYFCNYYKSQAQVIGISRTANGDPNKLNYDLTDPIACINAVRSLEITGIERVILIHSVGKIRWEGDNDYPLDLDIYESNNQTFMNLAHPLVDRTFGEGQKLTLVSFGSISDCYSSKFWRSYNECNNHRRRYMMDIAETYNHVDGRWIRLPTLNTQKQREMRPDADRKYWLHPLEVVLKSAHIIDSPGKWEEVTLCDAPRSILDAYFNNPQKIISNWII